MDKELQDKVVAQSQDKENLNSQSSSSDNKRQASKKDEAAVSDNGKEQARVAQKEESENGDESLDEELSEILDIPDSSSDSIEPENNKVATQKEKTSSKQRVTRKKLEKENERLSRENHELKDKYLRLAAEMENFRKRTERDLYNRVQNSFAELVAELLPILDDLERPLKTSDDSKDYDNLLNGIKLIHQKFSNILEARGVKAMDTIDKEFDPVYHEALTQMPSDDKPSGVVLEEHLKGYTFNDKVLRAAKVIISQ